jgi:DNA-nicking Smr family endonuclease
MARAKTPPPAPGDQVLWERLTQQVKPLRGRKAKPPAAPPAAPPKAKDPPPSPPDPKVAPKPKSKAAPPAPLASGATAGIDRRTAERLRRGQLPIDARLDLHGMYQDAAYAALSRFLDRSIAQGLRVLLIVTGKGDNYQEGGVLRRMLPLWLDEGRHRDTILTLRPAHRQHGGEGAFYLMLRRKRE